MRSEESGGEAYERALQSYKEEMAKMPDSELQLESEENRSSLDYLLGRCCIILSAATKLEDGSQQLLENGGLSILSTCIDIPIGDTRNAAIVGLRNGGMRLGMKNVMPSSFVDPAHLLRGLLSAASIPENLSHQLWAMVIHFVAQLHAFPEWKPYFMQLPPSEKSFFEYLLEKGVCNTDNPFDVEPVQSKPKDYTTGVGEACVTLTGKLRTCDGCGKLETKRGSMSKCSGCYEVAYCSREVS